MGAPRIVGWHEDKKQKKRILSLVLVVVTLLTAFLLLFANNRYRADDNLPSVVNAKLDLSDYRDYHSPLPLDGNWEFAWNIWAASDTVTGPDLVRDAATAEAATVIQWRTINLPSSWTQAASTPSPLSGRASYRLYIENCPDDLFYLITVPGCQTPYRVFFNGELTYQSGYLDYNPFNSEIRTPNVYAGVQEFQGRDCEVVIEVSGAFMGGLYMTPFLQYSRDYVVQTEVVHYVQALTLGLILMAALILALIVIYRDMLFKPSYLLVATIALAAVIFLSSGMIELKIFKIVGARFGLTQLLIATFTIALIVATTGFYSALTHLCPSKPLLVVHRLCIVLPTAVALIGFFFMDTSYLLRVWLASLPLIGSLFYRLFKSGDSNSLLLASAAFLLMTSLSFDILYTSGILSGGFLHLVMSVQLGVVSVLFLIVLISLYVERNIIAQRDALLAERLQLRVKEAEVSAMLSQIHPHFIYNTLTTVMALLKIDTVLAENTLGQFAKYLRTNIDALKSTAVVPFERELEHIRTYLTIEKLRFAERLQVEYDIQATNFMVPQLCVQPIVENAVKHGVCQVVDGGCVRISTHENDVCFVVEVLDNGVGFDASVMGSSSESSAGLENAIFRLEHMMNARVVVESAIGEGTRVTILISKTESVSATNEMANIADMTSADATAKTESRTKDEATND
jgi:signal transduction histidine kinase